MPSQISLGEEVVGVEHGAQDAGLAMVERAHGVEGVGGACGSGVDGGPGLCRSGVGVADADADCPGPMQ